MWLLACTLAISPNLARRPAASFKSVFSSNFTRYHKCNPEVRVRSSFLVSTGNIRSKWYAPRISNTSSVEGIPERVIAPPLLVATVRAWSRISVIAGSNLISNSPEVTSAGSWTSVPPVGVDGCSITSCSEHEASIKANSAVYKKFFFIVLI